MKFEISLDDKKTLDFYLHSSITPFWLGVEFKSLNPVFVVGILDSVNCRTKLRCNVIVSSDHIGYKPINEADEQIKRREK